MDTFLNLGEELGQPHYAVPFLAPNTTGRTILHGVNYASGGGGIMNATGRIFVSQIKKIHNDLIITELRFINVCVSREIIYVLLKGLYRLNG